MPRRARKGSRPTAEVAPARPAPVGSAPVGAAPTRSSPALRGRLWVELGGKAALTEAAADLLEQIDATGSLSAAARALRFSYRRAWMLLDAMNRHWGEPLVLTATGGKQGGGATLTARGRAVLSAYRDLQVQLEHLLDRATPAFRRAARSDLA